MSVSSGCSRGAVVSTAPASPEPSSTSARASSPSDPLSLSRRVYELGEAAWAGGAKFEAVALWRQAFRSLPSDEKYDVLRHRMVIRIGYALVELHRLDGDAYHLRAAQQMLTRWIEARADRDTSGAREEAYALLSEVELRLEEGLPEANDGQPSSGEADHDQSEYARALMLASYDGKQREYAAADTHAGEVLDADGIERKIEVSGLATLDDPRVWAFLHDPRPEGPSLFEMPGEAFNPTRPLVRAGLPKIAVRGLSQRREANHATWTLIRELRPALELCYASSMARKPTQVVRMRVTISVDDIGRVTATRQSGDPLGDSIGDDCLRRSFERAHVEAASLYGQQIATVPLTFFIQPGRGLAPSLQGMPGFDAAIGDRQRSYDADRVTETSGGVSQGQPTQ